MPKRNGFTMVELLISLALVGLVVTLLTLLYLSGLKSSGSLQAQANIQHSSRKAVNQLVAELRRSRNISIPTAPNNTSFSATLPVFKIHPTSALCSAHSLSESLPATPVTCSSNADCQANCGSSSTCFTLTGAPAGICEKRYTYSLITVDGINRLTASANSGDEDDRIIAAGLQNITFENSTMNASLRSNEIKINLTAQDQSEFEERIHQSTLQAIVHVRN